MALVSPILTPVWTLLPVWTLAALTQLVPASGAPSPSTPPPAPSASSSSAPTSSVGPSPTAPRPAQPAGSNPAILSIAVSGNHFVNATGQTVRLLGVNAPGSEYACVQGWGYSGQSSDAREAAVIAGWQATAVRIPLNEDCWLNLHAASNFGTAAGYRQFIVDWVTALNAAGLYAILDLHWSAPGMGIADGQRPMPDDHSAAFWTSVATTFKSNPAVVFDAFNEPYSPRANGNSALALSWSCWRDGGCLLPVANQLDRIDDTQTYSAVGMQTLVNAIRATGALQPILLGGLSYANDMSGWLANAPTDPAGQLAASWHEYDGEQCGSSCWSTTVAGLATHVPVVTGEFDEGYDCVEPRTGAGTFDAALMSWADQNGVSYLAWGWWVLDNTATTPCGQLSAPGDTYALISDVSGTPVAPDGTVLHDHLAALASSPPSTTPPLLPTPPTAGPPPARCLGTSHPVCTE